jgi:hypothetical protein
MDYGIAIWLYLRMTKKMLFELGRVVATRDALEALQENNTNITELLIRHVGGDWSNLSDEDRLENERSVKNGWRILSSYQLNNTGCKVWIITEPDRSSTCVLLPSNY